MPETTATATASSVYNELNLIPSIAERVVGPRRSGWCIPSTSYKELPHVRNSIVSVKMKLGAQAAIPAFIYDKASDCMVQVYCDKQQKVRHRCLEKGHIAAWCRKPLKNPV